MKYVENLCTPLARPDKSVVERIEFKIWIDKHYDNREQFGDEDGKREGIDWDNIKKVVYDSLKHMVYYSSVVKGFSFVATEPTTGTVLRVVLQKEEEDGEMLNIAIEIRLIELSIYELTVKTAKKTNYFRKADGQYVIELINENTSELKIFKEHKLQTISRI
jgi:hypothetical protein